jgi:ABC-type branched-subunit amino acid transport system substrate-binding protein
MSSKISRVALAELLGLGAWLASLGCSSPDLSGTNFTCSEDSDCGSGQICADLNGALACQASATVPIRIGMSAPLQGPSEALGNEMRRGINAMLDHFNRDGGVAGRRVELEALNDNYDPEQARSVVQQLLDIQDTNPDRDQPDVRGRNGVFALVGNVGTPTMLATAPVATKNKVIFFGAFTGAQAYLRDDTKSPYVYNYRAGYADETAAMLDYIRGNRIPRVINDPASDYQRLLVFAQEDSYGDSGYAGVVNAYNQTVAPLPDKNAIERVGYTREDVTSVDPAIAKAGEYLSRVLERAPGNSVESVAIIMIDTYQPGNRFIRGVKNWINESAERAARLDVLFLNVSFVGGDALSTALTTTPEAYDDIRSRGSKRSYAENVIVTQVVPNYDSQAAGVVQYREDIRAFDNGKLSFTSLEGYVVARLFTTALDMNGASVTTENFMRTLDTRVKDLDIGIGTELNFSSTNHQASTTVWGSHIEDNGSFSVPFVWKRDTGIVDN